MQQRPFIKDQYPRLSLKNVVDPLIGKHEKSTIKQNKQFGYHENPVVISSKCQQEQ